MHTEAFHTIERFRRTDANTIAYQFTVDDPNIFTRPWSVDWEMKLHPEWDKVGLFEMVCNENNRCEGGNCEKGQEVVAGGAGLSWAARRGDPPYPPHLPLLRGPIEHAPHLALDVFRDVERAVRALRQPVGA